MVVNKSWLEPLYHKYNDPKWIHPDPLEFVHKYQNPFDQEIVGLIASCLAYGRVTQILTSVGSVLGPMGPSPREFILGTSEQQWAKQFKDFRHRFTTGTELVGLLRGIKGLVQDYGSLNEYFSEKVRQEPISIMPALGRFVIDLRQGDLSYNSLLPLPQKGSACKRLHLFLRWMIRSDQVDPGPWSGISPSLLMVPLDTHMYRICSRLGMTRRKSSDYKCTAEITQYFKVICPEDPVKYDFALSRLGIRQEIFVLPDGTELNAWGPLSNTRDFPYTPRDDMEEENNPFS